MAAGGIIAALGVGLGAAFLLSRREQQATPVVPTNSCDSLPAGYARDACNAAKSIGGIVKGIADLFDGGPGVLEKWRIKDAKNKQLNGSVETPLLGGVRSCTTPLRTEVAAGRTPTDLTPGNAFGNFIGGSVLRFSNGCVPFQGAPGWERCAPGTESMGYLLRTPYAGTGHVPRKPSGVRDEMWAYDPTSGYFNPLFSLLHPDGKRESCAKAFPIPIPAGHYGYFFRGKPFTCPVGKHPDFNSPQTGPVVARSCLGAYVPAGSTTTTPTPTTPSVGQTYLSGLSGMGGLFESMKVNV